MKTLNFQFIKKALALSAVIFIGTYSAALALPATPKLRQADTLTYVQYKGSVIDQDSRSPLAFASLSLEGTNIVTITNTEGEFSLKVPKSMPEVKVTISFIGYKNKTLDQTQFKSEKTKIELEQLIIALNEIRVYPKDPELLIRAVMNKRAENYFSNSTMMSAFYRETIKKRKTYVSLSEAVVEIYKQPYTSLREDIAQLYKARKSTDYIKLDTLAFKLQGGPYTTLYLDVMKNPEMIFTEDMIGNYEFNLENVTKINDKLIYVLGFKQRSHISEPLYYGKLYIDTESLAITSATFNLNVENKTLASDMFIKKKPASAKVYPTVAAYHVDYREKNGKWYYGYSRGQITFKIDWNKRLFNTYYESTIEMAVTDWEPTIEKPAKISERMKPGIVMTDEISGFADQQFWGEHNVIEPEKSIESAIRKIQKKLEKEKQ
ncbi:MAG: carboxypeptidase-like regulatory domain-containing protein [Mariniphaga sp.]